MEIKTNDEIAVLLRDQNQLVQSEHLLPISNRIDLLQKLKTNIIRNQKEVEHALSKDLRKSKFESYFSEINYVLEDINLNIKKLASWSKPKCVGSSKVFFPMKSMIISEPYGKVLIISPWNYPFQLTFSPVIAALAAGNVVVLKPSEISRNSSAIITKIINETFSAKEVMSIEGAVAETTFLLEQKFDYIFYTGNFGTWW